jgi:hypothetical protein
MPKQFESAREDQPHCFRCAIKANEGLLFPLAKAFIFIHKPTVIIRFEDIDEIEFERMDVNNNSATRNFDMKIKLKAKHQTIGKFGCHIDPHDFVLCYLTVIFALSVLQVASVMRKNIHSPLSIDLNIRVSSNTLKARTYLSSILR